MENSTFAGFYSLIIICIHQAPFQGNKQNTKKITLLMTSFMANRKDLAFMLRIQRGLSSSTHVNKSYHCREVIVQQICHFGANTFWTHDPGVWELQSVLLKNSENYIGVEIRNAGNGFCEASVVAESLLT